MATKRRKTKTPGQLIEAEVVNGANVSRHPSVLGLTPLVSQRNGSIGHFIQLERDKGPVILDVLS